MLPYTYDADGIRTGKTSTTKVYKYRSSIGGGEIMTASADPDATLARYLYSSTTVNHSYITQNGKIVRETIGSGTTAKVLDFIYDESGKPFALKYTNGVAKPVTYYYVLNLQGDVVGLLNSSGTLVANYSYNAWGQITQINGLIGNALASVLDSNPDHIANINPLRYRGYYYDTETGFYYLQSRYYDPVTHRFINADKHTGTGQGLLGYNMFAYCLNNPVMYVDFDGEDIEVTIYTQEFEFDVDGGTVTVKYSLKVRLEGDHRACVRFDSDGIECEYFGGPASIIAAQKEGKTEYDLSMTIASYETEYGSISVALSLKGIGVTVTNELEKGFFEEITLGFIPNDTGESNPQKEKEEAGQEGLYAGIIAFGMGFAGARAATATDKLVSAVDKLVQLIFGESSPHMESGYQ